MRNVSFWLLVGLIVSVGILLAACSREIGDDCETNVQCSTRGNRQCDLSQPEGYCTVEGCDLKSCPDDSLCVRFFPQPVLMKPCTTGGSECTEREICISEGYCVESRLEHRFCMKSCSAGSDCRAGYQCQSSGSAGNELLPGLNGEPPAAAKFCNRVPPPPGTIR